MRVQAVVACVAVVLVTGACATMRSPVPVSGDLSVLAGEWAGEYVGEESGRSGSIVFELQAGTDTAYGDVLMTPSIAMQRGTLGDRAEGAMRAAPTPQVLTIAFTRVVGGRVSGTLDPYTDPDCDCQLVTTFTGELDGDRISGTYISRHQDGSFDQGRWSVRRRVAG